MRNTNWTVWTVGRCRYCLLAVLVTSTLVAQVAEQPVVLTIDVENAVIYRGTVFDASKLAKDPGPTTSVNQAFVEVVNVGDLVAVNGKPIKGLWSCTVYAMPYRQAPLPGQPIADFDLGGGTFCSWTIFSPEGTPVGMITDTGPAAGGVVTGHLVTGGLLGFFGVRRTGATSEGESFRQPSICIPNSGRRLC